MSQNNQPDSTNDTIAVVIILFVLYFVGVFFLGDTMRQINLALREAWLHAAMAIWPWPPLSWQNALQALEIKHPSEWKPAQIETLAKIVRPLMFAPFALLTSWYAYRVWKRNPGTSFRRIHDRQSLYKSESRLWPWIRPVLNLDLAKSPIDSGPWAMATRPLDFSRRYHLLEGKTINRPRAEKLFAAQLGKLWEGAEYLSPYKKGLYACFVAQACRDKDAAEQGLRTMANSMADGKLDVRFADPLLAKYGKDSRVQEVLSRHAYVATVLSGTLLAARRSGVLPAPMFLWLRPVNRTLWYTLNNLGRRTAFCDVAGIQAHFLAEQVANRALEQPYVGKAVDALEKALREVRFEN